MPFHLEVPCRLLELLLRLQRVQWLLVLRVQGLLLRLRMELELLELVRRHHGLHCLVVVEHLLVTSKRAWHGAEVHHHPPTTVAHLPCRYLQPLDLRFQSVIQSYTKNNQSLVLR
jgi:hypothetical protein